MTAFQQRNLWVGCLLAAQRPDDDFIINGGFLIVNQPVVEI